MTAEEIQDLIYVLDNEDVDIRAEAVEMLYQIGLPVLPLLLDVLHEKSWLIRFNAVKIIAMLDYWSPLIIYKLHNLLRREQNEYVLENLVKAMRPFAFLLHEEKPSFLQQPDSLTDDIYAVEDLREIPAFQLAEALEIGDLLASEAITFYRRRAPQYKASSGSEEPFAFWVHKNQFPEIIELLKEYFGIGDEQAFSGECPACGYEVATAGKCPDCGLNLSGSVSGMMESQRPSMLAHPFLAFLKTSDLL